jgi:hypothetical protein
MGNMMMMMMSCLERNMQHLEALAADAAAEAGEAQCEPNDAMGAVVRQTRVKFVF